MKIITLISLFLTLLPGFSCNETITKQSAKSKLQALLTIPISDSFKITDYEVEGGIGGDLTEAFIAHFTHEEFNNIFKKINPEKIKIIDVDLYGHTVEQGNTMRSAIFDPKDCTIKYTYHGK